MKEGIIRWSVELSVLALLALAVFAWGQGLDWRLGEVGALELFPLLGLVAFSTMWWHYLVGFVGRVYPEFKRFDGWHLASAYWVFTAFMLHPALLVYWGFEQGIRNVPDIYRLYAPGKMGFIILGYLALSAFIAYDLARWLRRRPFVRRNWRLFDAASDTAMIAIWFHAYNLGTHTRSGWYEWVWLGYGVLGLIFLYFKYRERLKASNHDSTAEKPAI